MDESHLTKRFLGPKKVQKPLAIGHQICAVVPWEEVSAGHVFGRVGGTRSPPDLVGTVPGPDGTQAPSPT